jgi:hypothetical protein
LGVTSTTTRHPVSTGMRLLIAYRFGHASVACPPLTQPATLGLLLIRRAISQLRSKSLRQCGGLKKGLGGFFQFLNGITLLALGVSIALGTRYPKWIGFVGALAGLGFVWRHGDCYTSFSATSGWFLTPATVLLAVFLIGVVILMWRRSGRVP